MVADPGRHYRTLGVDPGASPAQIREAYRTAARRHHPDHQARADAPASTASGTADAEMAALNEAYRVLRDPARRAVYDSSLRGPSRSGGPAVGRSSNYSHSSTIDERAVRAPVEPSSFPWKLVAGMAALGALVVFFGAAFYEPSGPAQPDNFLEPGSCVEIEYDGDASEIACRGRDDLVVRQLVAVDASCPSGTEGHRDAQGRGLACVEPPASSDP